MYLHITFADGSNPYVFFGDRAACEADLKRWSRNYIVTDRREAPEGILIELKEKARTTAVVYGTLF